ncbi:MAG: hypothetical protein LC808_27410 [Actinobacteria bacterium]|nr:hypothetical protein [Actinomycetota bacterium]
MTMAGTIRTPGCTGALGAAGDVVWRLRGYRKAPDDFEPLESSPAPSPSVGFDDADNPGAALANDSFKELCGNTFMSVPNQCVEPLNHARDWAKAMTGDVKSLRPKGAVKKAVDRLTVLIFYGSYMGAMTVYDECTNQDVPAFPIANGLLKIFAKSFVEGMAAAAEGDAAAVDRIAGLVDRLLFAIATAHPKPVRGGPCPSP